MKTLSAVTFALVMGAVGGMTNGATAAPITYDFTGTVSGNQALGPSQSYTALGGPTLTAISGSYSQSGNGAPVAGDTFTAGGQLVGNDRGTDEMGVGVCFGNGCNHGHIDDNPEIDASGREAVRLDISSLLSGFGSFTINAELRDRRRGARHFCRQRSRHRARRQARGRHQLRRQCHDNADEQLPLLCRRQHHHERRGCAPTFAHRDAERCPGACEPSPPRHSAPRRRLLAAKGTAGSCSLTQRREGGLARSQQDYEGDDRGYDDIRGRA